MNKEHGQKIADFTFYLWQPPVENTIGVALVSDDEKRTVTLVLNDPTYPPISLTVWENGKQIGGLGCLNFHTIYQMFLDKAKELTKLQIESN